MMSSSYGRCRIFESDLAVTCFLLFTDEGQKPERLHDLAKLSAAEHESPGISTPKFFPLVHNTFKSNMLEEKRYQFFMSN